MIGHVAYGEVTGGRLAGVIVSLCIAVAMTVWTVWSVRGNHPRKPAKRERQA